MRIAALALLLAATPVALSAQGARSISEEDRAAGAQAHPQLLAQFGGAYRGPQSPYVERAGKRVALQSGLSNASGDFTVTLLDSPIENAFAIPGGYVYCTRQLLALMNSEAELSFVLGHEIGHVAARHSAKRNTRSELGSLAAAVLGSVTKSDLVGRAAGIGTQLYSLGFSRAQEYEADSLGVRYITGAGYNPFAAPVMLSELNDETHLQAALAGRASGPPTWMSTHPNGADRIGRAAQLAQATGQPNVRRGQDTTFLRMLDGLPYDDGSKMVRVVAIRPGDTAAGLAARMAYPDHQRERFLILNGLDPDTPLVPGRLVKIIVPR